MIAASPKPSFWMWDKVYTKLTTYEEALWLLRSLEGVLVDCAVLKEDVRCIDVRLVQRLECTIYKRVDFPPRLALLQNHNRNNPHISSYGDVRPPCTS
jgi:hypothetical protein